jgi:hypothetical protein
LNTVWIIILPTPAVFAHVVSVAQTPITLSSGQKAFVWDMQPVVQSLHHLQAEPTLVVQHFGNATTGANKGLKVFGGESLLLHSELDRLDWISHAYRVSKRSLALIQLRI